MYRRNFIIALLSGSAALGAKIEHAAGWALITEDEFKEESKKARPKAAAAPPPLSDQPVIEVVEPDPLKPVRSPVSIRIRFQAHAGATINPKSFRAHYGWFDITDRLVAHAELDASGISANNADIPAGDYTVTLQIADNRGRVGTRILKFTVV
jgi:hypothetical protein